MTDTQLEAWPKDGQLTHRAVYAPRTPVVSDFDIDRAELARAGKKQVLKVV